MRTRSGMYYTRRRVRLTTEMKEEKRKRICWWENFQWKRRKTEKEATGREDFFDQLPDDIVLCILSNLSSHASSPGEFMNVLSTCKRLNGLGLHPLVLRKASTGLLSLKASKFSESAHGFIRRCANAGNVEACFTLGMIQFYCLGSRGSGASLMANAAIASYPPALYSLAVIQFNGSGGTKNDKDLRAGVSLCARAASLGHIDALREFGHCLQDGYGVRRNVAEGRRFLVQANAGELASVLGCNHPFPSSQSYHRATILQDAAKSHPRHADLIESRWQSTGCPLLSDFGCNVPPLESHPVNRFLVEWFLLRPPVGSLRLCSYSNCGKVETRKHEFRRCSVCGNVNYCSRACQALDWKMRHKHECLRLGPWQELHEDYSDDEDKEEGEEDDEPNEEEEKDGMK